MAIHLTAAYAELVRSTIDRMIPSIGNSELFSASVTAAIANRLGISRERTSLQDAEITRNYAAIIDHEFGRTSVYGEGISDRGCKLTYMIQWPDEQSDDGVLLIDPHGFWFPKDCNAVFTERATSGPLLWVDRKVTMETGRPQSSRVRRLETERRNEQWLDNIGKIMDVLDVQARKEIPFFRAFTHAVTQADPKTESPLLAIKAPLGGYPQILSSWPLEGGGFGFLHSVSPDMTFPVGTGVYATPELLKVLASLFDRHKLAECTNLVFQRHGAAAMVEFRYENGAVIEIVISRENSALAMESLEGVLNKAKMVISRVTTGMPEDWGVPHSLEVLSDGLAIGAAFASDVSEHESHAGVQVQMYPSDTTGGYSFRSRNMTQMSTFRLTPPVQLDAPVDTLMVTPGIGRSVARVLKIFVTDFDIRKAHVRFVTQERNQLMILRSDQAGGIIAGCYTPRHLDCEHLFSQPPPTAKVDGPVIVVNGNDMIDAASFAFVGVQLPGINNGNRKPELTQPAYLLIRNNQLAIETGSDVCVAGSHAPILQYQKLPNAEAYGNGQIWIAVQVAAERMKQSFLLLDRVRRSIIAQGGKDQKDIPRTLIYQFLKDPGGAGLFLTLLQERTIIAKIAISQVQFCSSSKPAGMPEYLTISPLWHNATAPFQTLPAAPVLAALSNLHETFRPVPDLATTTQLELLLSGLYYEANEQESQVLIGSRHRVVKWTLDESIFGQASRVFPGGFFEAAHHVRTFSDGAQFALEDMTVRVVSPKAYVSWRKSLPRNPEGLYPRDKYHQLLDTGNVMAEPVAGFIPNYGPVGEFAADIYPEVILERLAQIRSDKGHTHAAWFWNARGQHQLIPQNQFAPSMPFPTPMQGSISYWDCNREIFYICLNMQLLETGIKSLLKANQLLEIPNEPILFRFQPNRIKLVSDSYEALIMPLLVPPEDEPLLKGVRSLEE